MTFFLHLTLFISIIQNVYFTTVDLAVIQLRIYHVMSNDLILFHSDLNLANGIVD